MINIVKASAGSGKTFRLAGTYIRLLFNQKKDENNKGYFDRYSYRHILAVTFTNKATDEMKNRILKELSVLAVEPEKSPYKDMLVPSIFSDLSTLQREARLMLSNILHDYSAFSVSTIDRFFQQTLKAFAREIGQFASYQVELDKDSLVTESVDRILDNLREGDEGLLKWLTDSALDQIEKTGKYNLEYGLKDMAIRLKSEAFRTAVDGLKVADSELYNIESLRALGEECRKILSDFPKKVSNAAKEVAKARQQSGVEPTDFSYKFLLSVEAFADIDRNNFTPPTDAVLARASDSNKWFSAKNAAKLLPQVEALMEGPMSKFVELWDSDYKLYNTAKIISDQLFALGIAGEIDKEFKAILKEKNVLSIDDTNLLLKNIIDGSDVPFVYEKTGVRYENFLLDEFQDTSRIQWDNFKPLLLQSASNGNESLIVGDVKQSIYRWRGSDWKLLNEDIKTDLIEGSAQINEETLNDNYRSCRNVIAFNNNFFEFASKQLSRAYGDDSMQIENIYKDVRQFQKKQYDGYVGLTFCKDAKGEDSQSDVVVEKIKAIREKGALYSDIAVLVRFRRSGVAVAERLIQEDIPVITDDSLKVKSSVTVRRLTSLMSWIENPEDTVNSYLASTMDLDKPKTYLSLTDLCEQLLRIIRAKDPKTFDGEVLYIQSFVDAVADYSATEGNDVGGFLKKWADSDPVLASPPEGDAVRIITVHKSKGLDFQFVIFPYVDTIPLFESDKHWCSLDDDIPEKELVNATGAVYDVNLSSQTSKTYFATNYNKELLLQYVDNLNIIYVSMTRAVKGMEIVGKYPSNSFIKELKASVEKDDKTKLSYSNFSQLLYTFALGSAGRQVGQEMLAVQKGDSSETCETFTVGQFPEFQQNQKGTSLCKLKAEFPSFPLNVLDEEDSENDKIRLKLNSESSDFFDEAGKAGVVASNRLRGVVLHDIMAGVKTPDDLKEAIRNVYLDGCLAENEARSAYDLLSKAINSVRDRGWFPEDASKVKTEVTIIDTDGSLYRPDRIVQTNDGVVVIDYKFGEHSKTYQRQIAKYVQLLKDMGYGNVSSALWYIFEDRIIS